jgi:hypothetical protein
MEKERMIGIWSSQQTKCPQHSDKAPNKVQVNGEACPAKPAKPKTSALCYFRSDLHGLGE